MEHGIQYMAALNHITSNENDTPIVEYVSDYLRANPLLTVKDLMEYLLTHNSASFDSTQKNIATIIRCNQEQVKQYSRTSYLGIRLLDPEGDFREIPEHARRIEREQRTSDAIVYGTYFLSETGQTLPLFERYEIKCHASMVLSMIVTGVVTGGAPYKNENKVS